MLDSYKVVPFIRFSDIHKHTDTHEDLLSCGVLRRGRREGGNGSLRRGKRTTYAVQPVQQLRVLVQHVLLQRRELLVIASQHPRTAVCAAARRRTRVVGRRRGHLRKDSCDLELLGKGRGSSCVRRKKREGMIGGERNGAVGGGGGGLSKKLVDQTCAFFPRRESLDAGACSVHMQKKKIIHKLRKRIDL